MTDTRIAGTLTPDEQTFWDRAFCAALTGVLAAPGEIEVGQGEQCSALVVEMAELIADVALAARQRKSTPIAPSPGEADKDPRDLLELLSKTNTAFLEKSAEAERLREALTEVMEWIDNWSPSFTEDDEWEGAYAKVCAALHPKPEEE